jgi:hypothetical protein
MALGDFQKRLYQDAPLPPNFGGFWSQSPPALGDLGGKISGIFFLRNYLSKFFGCYFRAVGSIDRLIRHAIQSLPICFRFARNSFLAHIGLPSLHKDSLTMHKDLLTILKDSLTMHKDSLMILKDSLMMHKDSLTILKDSLMMHKDSLTILKDSLTMRKGLQQISWDKSIA